MAGLVLLPKITISFVESTFFDFEVYSLVDQQTVEKQVIVFVQQEQFNEAEEALLEKIIQAVGLTMAQIHIVPLAKAERSSAIQLKSKSTSSYLLFGVPPTQVGFHLKMGKYQPITINNYSIMQCDGLDTIATDKTLKTALWKALKTIFGA